MLWRLKLSFCSVLALAGLTSSLGAALSIQTPDGSIESGRTATIPVSYSGLNEAMLVLRSNTTRFEAAIPDGAEPVSNNSTDPFLSPIDTTDSWIGIPFTAIGRPDGQADISTSNPAEVRLQVNILPNIGPARSATLEVPNPEDDDPFVITIEQEAHPGFAPLSFSREGVDYPDYQFLPNWLFAPANARPLTDPLGAEAYNFGSWSVQRWPWVYHFKYGWIYIVKVEGQDGFWWFDRKLQSWMYTALNPQWYPLVYIHAEAKIFISRVDVSTDSPTGNEFGLGERLWTDPVSGTTYSDAGGSLAEVQP